MERNMRFSKIAILLLVSISLNSVFARTDPPTTVDKLDQIASNYETSYFDMYPEYNEKWGRHDQAPDRFSDHSLGGIHAWQKKEDELLSQLVALPEAELQNTPQHITYQLLKQKLQSQQAIRICKDYLWNISNWGWHNQLSEVAERQPVGTPQNRVMALKRWQSVDKIVDAEIQNLTAGLKEGYSAPKPAVKRAIKQIKIMLDLPVEKSPFYVFAKQDGEPQFKIQVAQIIKTSINPALKRYTQFLEKDYLPQARDQIGITAHPHGKECYAAKIDSRTTLPISSQAIVDYGISHMQQLQQEVATIGQKQFGMGDMPAIFKHVKTNPQNFFKNEQAMLDYDNAAFTRAMSKLPAWFNKLPKAKGIVQPYPLHRAQTGALGEYSPPCEDGSCPGIFYFNTYEPQKRSRVDQEATLFHELVPGHHLQFALASENKNLLSVNKYLWNSGYGEGWALYAERLADDMGLYIDDISRLGMLSNEALRTARLVVDPGIHVMGWTREQAVSYLKQHTALDDNIIENEVDRYIMMPAQATAYMLGKNEIDKLRATAQSKLKEKFDIREFHNQVLKNGCITLPMLKTQIEQWLEVQKDKN
jgi:uncharacterized protein (DUF885 family)